MRRFAVLAVSMIALAAPAAAFAQQGTPAPLKRNILATHSLSIPGREAVQASVELAAGGVAPRHTHAGEETGFILEGTGVIEVAGQEPQSVKAGDAFFIPANTPHLVRNTGTVTIKLVATYIVESGKPLATPAPQAP